MLKLCMKCHEYYNEFEYYTYCPHEKKLTVVVRSDWCDTHKLVPSQYSGEVCPLCTAEKQRETVGKCIKFISGFYRGEHAIILHYRGHSVLAGHSFEVLLRNGVRVITTDRHFKLDNGNRKRKIRNTINS